MPEYQRPFSWDDDNFDDLIDDVISANKDQEYFLGTMVLHQHDEDGQYDIVDGQQRLTSILILFACLRDSVEDAQFKTGLQEKILQQKNVVDGIPERVRLEVKDRKIFSDVVVTETGTLQEYDENELADPQWRYTVAVDVFLTRIKSLSQEQIQELITFINQKCVIVFLSTNSFADAFRLFTIVNDRGVQLRRIDIIKALNIAPDVITKDTVRNSIAQKWEDTENELGEDIFEDIFHFVRLITLKDKPQGDILNEFEKRIFERNTISKGEPFLNIIFGYAQKYQSIFEDRDIIPENEGATHNKYRALIHIMDKEFRASEWRACLLAFSERFGANKFYEFCLLMEKVYLAEWVKGIRKDERFASYSSILGQIENAKEPEQVLENIKYDEAAIIEGAKSKDLYLKGFGKYMLLRLELVTSEHDNVRELEAKSVEHVLPQNPDTKGYWADNHDLTKIDEYVHSIGNLILLSKSKNSSAQNYDFDKKKSKYLASRVTEYPRSIEILTYKEWTKKVIEERTESAAKIILENP